MKKAFPLLLIAALVLISCDLEQMKKDKEIEDLKYEIELYDGATFSKYSKMELDSMKMRLKLLEGKVSEKEFNEFCDSVKQVRIIESYNWAIGSGSNPIDGEWNSAVSFIKGTDVYLKIMQKEGAVWFMIKGMYVCDDNPTIDLAFDVNGETIKFQERGEPLTGNDGIIVTDNLESAE